MSLPLPLVDSGWEPRLRPAPRALVLTGVLLGLATLLGLGSGLWPRATFALAVGSLLVAAMLVRLEWAVLVVVASAPFTAQPGLVDGRLAAGLVVLLGGSWVVDRSRGSRSGRGGVGGVRGVPLGAVLLAVVVVGSLALHDNGPVGRAVTLDWLVVITAMAVIVDAMRSVIRPITVVRGYVAGASVSAVLGLAALWWPTPQSWLPIGVVELDVFAFALVLAAPLALALRYASTRWLWWCDLALVVLILGVVATTAWTMVIGLVVILAVAAATRMISVRAVATVTVLLGTTVAFVLGTVPGLVESAIDRGEAQQRTAPGQHWEPTGTALRMTARSPVIGFGPGAYALYQQDFRNEQRWEAPPSAHRSGPTYLGTSAELGLVGLGALLIVLLGSVRSAWQRWRADQDPIAAGVVIALVGSLVVAVGMSAQHVLALWVLIALGLAVRRPPEERALPASLVRLRRETDPHESARQHAP